MNSYELMKADFPEEDLEGSYGYGELFKFTDIEEDALEFPLYSDMDEYDGFTNDLYYSKDEIATEFDDSESLVGQSEDHEADARRNTGWSAVL